jgi:hypothetical protein
LGDLAPSRSSLGSLISFSTQPGNVALDGIGRNWPFVTALRTYLDRYPQGTYADPARMLMARLERWEAEDAKRRADRFQPGNPDARWRLSRFGEAGATLCTGWAVGVGPAVALMWRTPAVMGQTHSSAGKQRAGRTVNAPSIRTTVQMHAAARTLIALLDAQPKRRSKR